MLKQKGITVLELLIGLSVMSGVSVYTVQMAEEVEDAVSLYENRIVDVKTLRDKLKTVSNTQANYDELLDIDEEFLVVEQF